MRNNTLFVLLLMIVCTAVSCKKEPDAAVVVEPPVHVPDFEVTGQLYVHMPVKFTSNFSQDKELTWLFGDNTEQTIMGRHITYTYTNPGTYTVSMAVTDGFGGTVSKAVTITNGTERVANKQDWNFFLTRYKHGAATNLIPPATFANSFSLIIVNDSTIQIPDIPQMRLRGPYLVKKVEVSATRMIFKSDDLLTEFSYVFEDNMGGIKLTQVHKDTTWHLNGFATIVN